MTKDIEREAFEEWIKSNYPISKLELLEKHSDGGYQHRATRNMFDAWQAAKSHEAEKLKGCMVVPVELSESIAEKLALGKVEKPRQENDVVWQEIADRSYKDHLIQKKWEIIRNYKELVEAARGGK